MMIQMMMQAAQRGMSPTQFFQQYGSDPNIAPLAKIVQGKNHDELMQTASNMAQQRGTTLDAFAQKMGIPMTK